MKHSITIQSKQIALFGLSAVLLFASCKKDGNPNKLPSVSTADYVGTIDGYTSSNEVYPENLVAYWSFDANTNESLTNTAANSSEGATIVDGGVRGKALNLTAGYVYFTNQFAKFNSDSLRNFSISAWVKILNNGSRRTMLFQMARPGMFNGNINFQLNTQSFPASNTTTLRIQPTFMTQAGGTQDNLNSTSSPTIGADKWTHLCITYNISTGVFDIYADGLKIGNFPNRGTVNTFFCHQPNEVIIGTNYNNIPGKTVNTDATFNRMTGQIDEIRVYNRPLGEAFVRALYNLGRAGK